MNKLEFEEYIQQIKKNLIVQLEIAASARNKRLDPTDKIESILSYNPKSKISAILDIPGLEDFLPENLTKVENLVIFSANIASQIVNERFIKKPREDLILLALHSALVILSQGLISVPQESIPKVSVSPKSNHLTIYFSNTVRYVDGEVIGLVIFIADIIRDILHLDRFIPTPELTGRYVEELEIYYNLNDKINSLRRDIVELLVYNIGIEISGEPYERIEVIKYRNLPSVTNQLRMGMCVAIERFIENINDIALKRLNSGILKWNWLKYPFSGLTRKKLQFGLHDVRATQPLLSESNKPGGFRLRYGLSRNIGQGAVGIHPSIIYLVKLLTPGTNIRMDVLEGNLTVFPVINILGPLVELKDGSARRMKSLEETRALEDEIVQIWEMGDILLSPNDIPTAESIEETGWSEEWWSAEIWKYVHSYAKSLEVLAARTGIDIENLRDFLEKPTVNSPNASQAIGLAKVTKIPLHPSFSLNWNEITISELLWLLNNLSFTSDGFIPFSEEMRLLFLRLGMEFKLKDNLFHSEHTLIFEALKKKEKLLNSILMDNPHAYTEEIVSMLIEIPLKSLCQRRIGVKIIKAEKAEPRQINPPAHILFPIGNFGGPQRNLLKISKEKQFKVQLSERFCPTCEISTFTAFCPKCKQETEQHYICREGHVSKSKICEQCDNYGFPARYKQIDLGKMIEVQLNKIQEFKIKKIKGISYLNNRYRIPEHIMKGILRSYRNLYVYKDGTIRFDQTNAILRFFKPKEVNSSIDNLKRLGYTHDVNGNDINDENQLLELFPYDIIVSENAADYLVDIAKFLDDELIYLYDMLPYFRINTKKDINGILVVGMSPFSMVGVIGRIIGYSRNNVLYAHPLWHKLKTRNCSGNIDSIAHLLDIFLNFSKELVPNVRGGSLDVPNIINLPDSWEDTHIYSNYLYIPLNLQFYQSLKGNPSISEILSYNESFLTPKNSLLYTIDDISLYDMKNDFQESKIFNKIESELKILRVIRGVNEGEFVDKILEYDLLEKISGSFDRFFLQPVRCKACNKTFRRVPISDSCPNCQRKTLTLTLSEGWVLRYLQIVKELKEKYSDDISDYSKSWIDLIDLNKRLYFDRGPRHTTLI